MDPQKLFIQPHQISSVLKSINQNAATVKEDIPVKLFTRFSSHLSMPLTHIINCMFEQQVYPQLWKREIISPIPKSSDSDIGMKQLRPISGLLTCSKIADKVLSQYILSDMGVRFDKQQYGNQKGMSINHLLINMLHKILLSVDKNSEKEKYAVVLTFLDFSQAFERQNHKRGVQSFIENGVRPELIPILISFFQNRDIQVKWNGIFSSPLTVTGGGPQGGTAGGILE